MAKPIDLTTIGIRFGYAIEVSAGSKPSSFTNIPNPKSTPDFNPEPNAIDITSLNDLIYKRYTKGLKDLGGALSFTIGMSAQLLKDWNDMVTSSESAKALEKRTWFVLYHPSLDKSFFFTGEPAELGFPEAEVDAAWDANVFVAPTGEIGWSTAINPTDPAST